MMQSPTFTRHLYKEIFTVTLLSFQRTESSPIYRCENAMCVEVTAHGLQCAFLLRPRTSIRFACIMFETHDKCLFGQYSMPVRG